MKSLGRADLGRADVEILEQKTAFQGFFQILSFRLRHRLFKGGWSEDIKRELFHRGEAAAAVLYDPINDRLGLVEQFRIGALDSEHGPWCLEVVAGMLEPGETAEQVICREIEEEAGITKVELEFVTTYYSTPGGCSEKVHLYCALCDLSEAGGVYGLDYEGEDIRFQTYAPDEVFEQMYCARTNNSATLIGLQWLQAHRASLRARLQK
ncbi:NUDIX domain-containing protein [Agaribacterium sp. ZY112]